LGFFDFFGGSVHTHACWFQPEPMFPDPLMWPEKWFCVTAVVGGSGYD